MVNAYLRANELTIRPDNFATIALFYAICAVLHATILLEMLCRSIQRRRLYFHRYKPARRSSNTLNADSSLYLATKNSTRAVKSATAFVGLLQTSGARVNETWDRSFGVTGVFGIGGKNFAYVFLIREVTETILQSIQAYQLSKFAPCEWLNHIAVLVVSVGCWPTPAIQHLLSQYPRLELILCLLFDITLDFVSNVGVPVAFIAQYLRGYESAPMDFGFTYWDDKVWVAQMNSEFKLLFIQSWVDFAVCCRRAFPDPTDAQKSITVEPQDMAAIRMRWSNRAKKVAHTALVLWGCIILGLHIDSTTDERPPDCKVQVRPWLGSKPACNYMDIDCAVYPGMVGKANELEAIWKEIAPNSLQMLVVRNCPEFYMPPSIQTFPSLSALLSQNLKIQEWSHEAALSSKHHPPLRQAALVFVDLSLFCNGSVLPPGLTAPDFPTTIGTLFIAHCGLAELPSSLDAIWPPGINMLFMGNGLTKIPDVFFRMNLIRLALPFNKLRELRMELFELPTLKWLDVNFNPLLQGFPAHVQNPSSALVRVDFKFTNVSVLPEWM